MTTYRLFPSTSGPNAVTAFTGNYIAGVCFEVTQGGMWFQGYWWWVCPTGGLTAPQKCALWSYGFPHASGTLVPGSVVTSGTLVSGWNYIPLATPIQIAPSSTYIAAIAVNGAFPDTASQFGSGQPLAGGITNGPLVAYSDTGGTNPEPYANPQGIFSDFAGGDPSTQMPNVGNSSSNLWADVQVSDTAPAGYSGTYRLWPNKFDANTYGQAGTDAAQNFVLATEIRPSVAVSTSWVWFHSPPASASLPTWCGVYRVSDQSIVAQNTSPSWLTPSGSGAAAAAGGWCKAALSAALPAGDYKVAVFNAGGTTGGWSPYDYGYWLTGGGKNGITSGPLTAPNQASASTALIFNGSGATEPSQGTFSSAGTLHYPDTAVDYHTSGPVGAIAESFWVDLEATPVVSGTGTAALTLAGSASGSSARSGTGTAALSLAASGTGVAHLTGERELVRLAVAAYFGGSLVTTDGGICYQGGPLVTYGLGTAYPYSVKGVPDEYYTAGQPDGQGWGVVMSTTRLRRVTTRDSYGGATSGWRARKYLITCELALICEVPHIETAGAALDNLIDAMFTLIAADRTLGTLGAPNGVQIIQAGEGKSGAGGPGITDETDKFEQLDHDRGRYAAQATVTFEALTMVAS